MTTPTNDRQTSERERLAEWLESAGKGILTSEIARQLRADEAEIAALRAENEALRTDAERYREVRLLSPRGFSKLWDDALNCYCTFDEGVDVIRSKESSRG